MGCFMSRMRGLGPKRARLLSTIACDMVYDLVCVCVCVCGWGWPGVAGWSGGDSPRSLTLRDASYPTRRVKGSSDSRTCM